MLSYGEKLQILLLCDLLDGLKIDISVDRAKIREAISSGNTWSFTWNILENFSEPSAEIVKETTDILSMWRVLEHDFDALPDADRQKVIDAVGAERFARFEGFDGNNDPHFGVASHLVGAMGRFDEFSKRDLNSHTSSSLPRYRRVLDAYRSEVRYGQAFTADQLANILQIKAQV